MMTLQEIKNSLFSDEQSLQLLLKAMKCEDTHFDEAFKKIFFETDDLSLQKILAPFLRARAVKVLRESQTFEIWRGRYIHDHGADALELFFKRQNTACVYGTDECAHALAELFNVSLQVTLITDPIFSFAAHTAPEDRPIFHIYNQPEHHWYIYNGLPGDTLGDGNCLFNSFAQIVRNEVLADQYGSSLVASDADTINVVQELQGDERDVVSEFFKHMAIYQTQDSLRAQFDKLPKLSIEKLAERIATLSKEESNDHLCALEYAVQDDLTKKCSDKNKQVISIENNNTPLLEAGRNLIESINEMQIFAKGLNDEKAKKIIEKHSLDLETMVKKAIDNGLFKATNKSMTFPRFEKKFKTLLNSINNEMKDYSVTWDIIVKNIAIALTGIGLLLVVGNLIYTQATEGHAMLFFQKPKNIGEEQLTAVKSSFAAVKSSLEGVATSYDETLVPLNEQEKSIKP